MSKLCLECEHCYFHPGCYGYSDWTPGYEASIGCYKGHWELDLYGGDSRESYREKIRSAEGRSDFTEDTVPHNEVQR